MTDRVVASEVEVALEPAAAFDVFTAELDYWWLRGPINNWDAARVTEMRCEPGVGGRLLEIYDAASDDMLELARITAWEPGSKLAWQSSVDDVRVEVHFHATEVGTRVQLVATVPATGRDVGGTSFVRVSPTWYGSWCAERRTAPRRVREHGQLGLAIYYAQPVAAAHWLKEAFGFEPGLDLPTADGEGDGWVELRAGNAPLMVFKTETKARSEPATHVAWVFVEDLDAHVERARAYGARIRSDVAQHGYRAYEADDLEGHRWTFAQARPTMLRNVT